MTRRVDDARYWYGVLLDTAAPEAVAEAKRTLGSLLDEAERLIQHASRSVHAEDLGCKDYKPGDLETSDMRFVTCATCRSLAEDIGARIGEECPHCGGGLPAIENGDVKPCPGCGVQFMAIDLHLVVPQTAWERSEA